MLHFVHIAAFDRKMDPAQLINFVISCGKKSFFTNPLCDFCIFFDISDLAASAMPDDRAIMTYVSSYYHTFAGAQKV